MAARRPLQGAAIPWEHSMAFPPQSPTPTFPYQVEDRIGEGAMGIVYRALEPSLERRVAVKTLHAPMLAGGEPEGGREHPRPLPPEAPAAAGPPPPPPAASPT